MLKLAKTVQSLICVLVVVLHVILIHLMQFVKFCLLKVNLVILNVLVLILATPKPQSVTQVSVSLVEEKGAQKVQTALLGAYANRLAHV